MSGGVGWSFFLLFFFFWGGGDLVCTNVYVCTMGGVPYLSSVYTLFVKGSSKI